MEDELIGVIVKSWENNTHDVYVRYHNAIAEYKEDDIKHFVYSKYLGEEEKDFY